MPVITRDVTIRGSRRDVVFEWLSEPSHHERILRGAFDVRVLGPGILELGFRAGAFAGTVSYELVGKDDDHGGRRVAVRLTGRCAAGTLRYSLRTTKPSTDTLVTLHVDYTAGGLVGHVLEAVFLRRPFEEAWRRVLQNLVRELATDLSRPDPSAPGEPASEPEAMPGPPGT